MGKIIGATGLVVALMMFGFGVTWAILHGIMEFGQYAGVYEWEPTAQTSFFATMVWALVRGLFVRAKT